MDATLHRARWTRAIREVLDPLRERDLSGLPGVPARFRRIDSGDPRDLLERV